jgi:hypothetical protein
MPMRLSSGLGRILGAGVLLVGLAGCRPDMSGPEAVVLPDLSGDWSYSAEEIRAAGMHGGGECAIDQVTLTLAPWRATGFFGRSDGGRLQCSGALTPLSTELPSYPIRRGGMVSHHIAFDFGNPEWRHQGYMEADTMWGTFLLRTGGAELTGTFKARRRR